MEITLHAEAPPLRLDQSGALRVGESRVLVELVVRTFEDGMTPEAIAQRYPTATLPDVYATIAYYLRHREEIEAYLATRERRAQQIRHHIESHQGSVAELRDRLPARQRSSRG